MNNNYETQVPKEHYYSNYDSLRRFITYYYQIDLVRKLKPDRILEIGVGNKTVTNYLRQNNYKVITCDFDKQLNPDYVADVRKLPFENELFDVVLACEILEHLPWKDVGKALNEIFRVTKKFVIVSLPYSSVAFEFIFRFPLIETITGRKLIKSFVRIPLFKKAENRGEHYWELGRRNFSKRKIRKKFEEKFKIKKELRPVLNAKHYFFVLEKKIN